MSSRHLKAPACAYMAVKHTKIPGFKLKHRITTPSVYLAFFSEVNMLKWCLRRFIAAVNALHRSLASPEIIALPQHRLFYRHLIQQARDCQKQQLRHFFLQLHHLRLRQMELVAKVEVELDLALDLRVLWALLMGNDVEYRATKELQEAKGLYYQGVAAMGTLGLLMYRNTWVA